ncbi:hypothetical protein ACUUL3_15145 [Thiovibrio sp. JS02]
MRQKRNKIDTSFWDERRGVIRSRIGGMVIGEAVYSHGYDIMEELVGKVSYFQMLVLNVTGRLPERRLADWLEALFICLSYPDSRIWCNQVGSLAGTVQASPVAAASGGILASDSRLYGPGAILAAFSFMSEALKKKQQGVAVEEIVKSHPKRRSDGVPVIPGYARPVARGDERIPGMASVGEHLGLSGGEHLALASEIDAVLTSEYGETMNLLGYATAFLLDQGITDLEANRLLGCWVSSGVQACYAEAADQPPESFFPLRCQDIDYQGKAARPVPGEE